MKILLFGITNVGKTTIGKLLSEILNYDFDDLDDEIKRQYKKIDKFQEKYPNEYDRHRKRGEILYNIVNRYEDNVVIAVSPIYYEEFFIKLLQLPNILVIELQDGPESVLDRLVYADENDEIHPIEIKTKTARNYYLKEIKADIKYYKEVYKKIENKFDIQRECPKEATVRLAKYIQEILK